MMEPAPKEPFPHPLEKAEPWHLRKDFRTLISIMVDISSELDLDELLPKVIHHATNLCEGDAGVIAMIDETGTITKRYPYKAPDAIAKAEIPRGEGAFYEAVKKRATIIVDDYPSYSKRIDSFVLAGVKSVLTTPIKRKDRVIGIMSILNLSPGRPFTRYHAGLLEAVATQTAVTIENARLYENIKKSEEDIKHRAKELSILNSLSNVLSQTLELDMMLNTAIDSVMDLLEADGAAIYLLDEENQILKLAVHRGISKHFVENSLEIPVGERLPGAVAESGEPIIIENLADYPEFESVVVYEAFVSLVGAPIKSKGRVIGAFPLGSRQLGKFTQRDATLLESIGNQLGVAIENSRLYEAQRHISELLQKSMLPAHLPSIPNMEIGVRYSSATEEAVVGGDFYDIYDIDGKYALVIGDVSGKGIEAAASTSMIKYMLRSYLYLDPSPSTAFTQVNRFIRRQIESGVFITVFSGVYDPATETMSFVNAGHPYPCLLDQVRKTCAVLTTNDPAVGIIEDYDYRENRVGMKPGNIFVAYTDGVIEARTDGEFFGEERLINALLDNIDKPAQEIADSIIDETFEFAHGKLVDDIALLVVRRVR